MCVIPLLEQRDKAPPPPFNRRVLLLLFLAARILFCQLTALPFVIGLYSFFPHDTRIIISPHFSIPQYGSP